MMLITGSSDLKVFIDLTPSWMPTPTMTAEGGGKIITKRLTQNWGAAMEQNPKKVCLGRTPSLYLDIDFSHCSPQLLKQPWGQQL